MKVRNITAIFHLAILPFIIFCLYQETLASAYFAFLLLFLSVFIDFVERLLFHKQQVESFLHPFSDKIVVFILLFVFSIRGSFSDAVLIFFIARDVIIGYLRMRASRDDVEISIGNYYGQAITSLQFFVVFLLLAETIVLFSQSKYLELTKAVIVSFVFITMIIALVSLFHYSFVYRKKLLNRKLMGKRVEPEQMVILANRKSGGYRDAYRRRLLRRFALRRKAKIYYLTNSGDVFEDAGKIVCNAQQVIIAGGDGTFESALNNQTLQKKSLGFFPLGAGNSYYSYFYRGKRFEYLRSRFHFRETPLDILELQWEKGKKLTGFLSLGIDAEVIKQVTRKPNHTFADYWKAGTAVAFGPCISYDITSIIDGKSHYWENCFNLIIAKISFIGYGLRSLIGRIEPDDKHMLGMLSVNPHSQVFNKALRLWQIFLSQLNIAKAPLIPLKGKEFFIQSNQPMALQAGGEFLGYTKWIKVKVKRQQQVLMI